MQTCLPKRLISIDNHRVGTTALTGFDLIMGLSEFLFQLYIHENTKTTPQRKPTARYLVITES
jgi:hypothetical protein